MSIFTFFFFLPKKFFLAIINVFLTIRLSENKIFFWKISNFSEKHRKHPCQYPTFITMTPKSGLHIEKFENFQSPKKNFWLGGKNFFSQNQLKTTFSCLKHKKNQLCSKTLKNFFENKFGQKPVFGHLWTPIKIWPNGFFHFFSHIAVKMRPNDQKNIINTLTIPYFHHHGPQKWAKYWKCRKFSKSHKKIFGLEKNFFFLKIN